MFLRNAANYFTSGLKGRFRETKLEDDHVLAGGGIPGPRKWWAEKILTKQVPALTALNERLRDDYIEEIADGVGRWQRVIDNAGIPVPADHARTKVSIARSGISRDTL